MYKTKLTLAVVAAIVFSAAGAEAALITFNGLGLHRSIDYVLNGSDRTNPAGEILVDIDGNAATAYCVDLRHGIKATWTADVQPVTFVNGGLGVAWLYDNFVGAVSNNTEAAGLQVAMWEVIEDFGGTLDLSAGHFQLVAPTGVGIVAQYLLNALPGDLSGYTPSSFILKSGNHPRSQHLIVPEPATLALLGMVLPVIGIRRRR